LPETESNRLYVTATLDDGNVIKTWANGSIIEIFQYYYGQVFNMGTVHDDMHKVVKLKITTPYGLERLKR